MRKSFAILMLGMIIVSAHFVYSAEDKTMVLYMPFNDGAGDVAKDQSMYGNNGTIMPANVTWVKGVSGGAISIDGQAANALVIPKSNSLSIEGAITMMAWIKPTAWSGDNHTQLFDKRCNNGGETNFSYGFDVGGNGGRLAAFLGSGDGRPVPGVDAPVELEKWQHVAATYDGKDAKFYLDGKLVGEVSQGTDLKGTNDFDLRVGCSDSRANYTFNGAIDDAIIFNRALDDNEIDQIVKNGLNVAVSPGGKLASTWADIKD